MSWMGGVRISEPSIPPICNFSCFLQTEFYRGDRIKEPSVRPFAIFTYFCKLSSIVVSEFPNSQSYKFAILAEFSKSKLYSDVWISETSIP